MPSGIEALAGRLDLSDAYELGDRLPIACDGDLLLALQHRLGSRPALAQVPHGDGLHGARLTCFTTLGPTGQIGATSLETRSVTRILAGLLRGRPAKDAQRLDPKQHGRFRARGGVHRRLRNPPGSPPKLDWWFPPGAVRTTPARRTRRHEPPAGLEHNPADDEVSEDLARLRDLAPQHRPPVGQAVADLALQARDLVAADPRGLVQLTLTVTKPDGSTFVTGGFVAT